MASRGRPSASKKAKVKVTSKLSAKDKAKGKKPSMVDKAVGAAADFVIGKPAKGKGDGKKVSASMLLKRAYERRAKRQIRIGQLGQARRTLRKKRTVI